MACGFLMLNLCPAPAKLTQLLEDLRRLLDTECLPSHGHHCLSSTSKVDLVGLTLAKLGILKVLSTQEVHRCNSLQLLLVHHPALLRSSGYSLHFSDRPMSMICWFNTSLFQWSHEGFSLYSIVCTSTHRFGSFCVCTLFDHCG